MDKDTIQKAVIAIIKDKLWMDSSIAKIDANTVLIRDTTCDSLDVVELVMEFEREFNVCISDDDAKKFEKQTIKQWAECIFKLGGNPSKNALNLIEEQNGKSGTISKPVAQPVKTKKTATPKNNQITLVKKGNKRIEFRQGGKVINLNNPQISPLIMEITEKLKTITR